MKNLLIISACFAVLITLYAFNSRTVQVILEGKVYDESQPIQSVNVQIESKPNYFETSIGSGYYRLQFNANEGNPLFILYSKDGYTTFRQSWVPAGDQYNVYTIPDVTLLKLKRSNPEQIFANPRIKIYASPDPVQQFNEVEISEISYFERVELLKPYDDATSWYKVNFTLKETGKRHTAYLLQ